MEPEFRWSNPDKVFFKLVQLGFMVFTGFSGKQQEEALLRWIRVHL